MASIDEQIHAPADGWFRERHPFRHAGPLVLWRTDGLLIAFPVIAYGFTAHQFLFNIYATLRVPSVKRMVNVVHHVR